MEYVIYKLLIYKESEDNLNLVLKKTILHCKKVFNYIKKLASVLLDEINCNVKMRSRQKEMRCFLSKKRNSTQ